MPPTTLTQEHVVAIKVLIRQRKSILEIARLLGVSRNTVRHHLREDKGHQYKEREPFTDYLLQRIREAHPAWLPALVVRSETAPGMQMQADFVVFRRGKSPLLAFVATLAYSRLSFVRFVYSEGFESVRG